MVILNKKALVSYQILDKIEAGIVLSGAEVKSVRKGSVSLTEGFVSLKNGQPILCNVHIAPYQKETSDYNPRRERKLLLHREEIQHLIGKKTQARLTLVPLRMYTTHNLVKVEIAIARGKKKYEKRETLKQKAIERDIEQSLREDKRKSIK